MGQIAHALLTRPPLELKSSSRNLPISIPARLACVKHAASVRPEPGSNSYVQSIFLTRPFLHANSPKPTCSPVPVRRLLSQNLTVLVFSLIYSIRCIVFKDRFAFVLSLNAGFIIAKSTPFVKHFFQFIFISIYGVYNNCQSTICCAFSGNSSQFFRCLSENSFVKKCVIYTDNDRNCEKNHDS